MKIAPLQIARCMGEIVPCVSEAMWDLKPEVKAAAKEALNAACNAIDNRCVCVSANLCVFMCLLEPMLKDVF